MSDLYTDLARTVMQEEFATQLRALVEIPTISMDPAHASDITRGAQHAVALLQHYGATAELFPTPGYPVVFGQFLVDPGYPTVAIYNHLDVQPADEPQWRHDPFRLQCEGERYGGRGTTDDKGPALTALLAARFAVQHGLRLNIQFLWEFEEEIGSPHLGHFLDEQRALVKCDSVLVSDTVWLARDKPAIPYALRGLLTVLLRLQTAHQDCHSGLAGGAARNPIGELAELIACCYDARHGKVSIPGFYETVRALGKEELQQLLTSGLQVETFKQAHGLSTLRSTQLRDLVQSIWSEPTFEVHGISGGYQGPGIKTIVPHAAEAKISMRLVADQQPHQVLALVQDFVSRQNPDVEVIAEGALAPYLGTFHGAHNTALREAMHFGFGMPPSFTREGGSIGAVVTMDRLLRVPIVFLGLSLPEHGYHAPNESFDWGQARGGIRAMVNYFERLAQIRPTASPAPC